MMMMLLGSAGIRNNSISLQWKAQSENLMLMDAGVGLGSYMHVRAKCRWVGGGAAEQGPLADAQGTASRLHALEAKVEAPFARPKKMCEQCLSSCRKKCLD